MRRLMVIFMFAGTAWGQTLEEQGYRPVDQMVEDVDRLGTTLRVEEPGIQTIGERNNVYRRIMPGADSTREREDRLYFISYGVVAEFDQSSYGIREEDGGILQFIPSNTVFHIGLPVAETEERRGPVAGQVVGRIEGRVEQEALTGMADEPVAEVVSEFDEYGELVVGQRAMVMAALKRLASGN